MASDLNTKLEVEEIVEWERNGLMTPEKVLARLDAKLNEFFWLKDVERTTLRQHFDAYSFIGPE